MEKEQARLLEERNRNIIDAVIKKADRLCPGSLALIGIYGSFATGDFYEKSDLDLLVLINDEKGWQLSCTFIQEDLEVGHDIYCTTWDSLRQAADCPNAQLAKLLDSRIVYCAKDEYLEELTKLRKKAEEILKRPFSGEDYDRAENELKQAEHHFLWAMTARDEEEGKRQAGLALYFLENAVVLLNKRYLRYGVKRLYEELESMEKKPEDFCGGIERVLSARREDERKDALKALMEKTVDLFRRVRAPLPRGEDGEPGALEGTLEEMFSNWRNKLYLAAQTGNRHLSFMSLLSLDQMLLEIRSQVKIGGYHVLELYDPDDLWETARKFDSFLEEYSGEYKKRGFKVRRYEDLDAFLRDYLSV